MTVTARTARAPSCRVAYVTRGLPHYRVPVWDALGAAGCSCHVVVAGQLENGFLLAETKAHHTFDLVELRKRFPGWRKDVLDIVRRARPDAIVLEHGASLDFTWTLLLSRLLPNIPRILWTHGIERSELYGGHRSPASLGRLCQLMLATGIVTYDVGMAKRLQRRFPSKVVGAAPNSTDGVPLLSTRRRLELEGRTNVRARRGLERQFYLIALGRLVKEKEFYRLPQIVSRLRSEGLDVGALFVGQGPDEKRIRDECRRFNLQDGRDVTFTGGVADPTMLAEWLYCADVCVNPGYLGLSIVDSLFTGIPVISAMPGPHGPYHSPEWNYLTPGTTGWLVDPNTDESLASQTSRYLRLAASERRQHEEASMRYAEVNLGTQRTVDGLLTVIRAVQPRHGT